MNGYWLTELLGYENRIGAWKRRALEKNYCGYASWLNGRPRKCIHCQDETHKCSFKLSLQELLFAMLIEEGGKGGYSRERE